MILKREYYLHLIRLALEEDIGEGDITSEAIIPHNTVSEALLIAKEDGIICGVDVFCDTMFEVDTDIEIHKNLLDGEEIKSGEVLISLKGKTISILKAERTALNFIQRMSGIASKTFRYVSKIKNYKTKILDTRKTLPAFRMLDKYAVFIGKGNNHRIGLYDMFLIKENHIKAVSEISVAIIRARNFQTSVKIEVETTNLEEVKEACLCCPNVIMLDNMNNENVEKALSIIKNHNKKHKKHIKTEVSGNVTEDRLIFLAKVGVDFISMGELTHSVKAMDLSLIIK